MSDHQEPLQVSHHAQPQVTKETWQQGKAQNKSKQLWILFAPLSVNEFGRWYSFSNHPVPMLCHTVDTNLEY